MLVSKTPLRVSFCGGGSDLYSFYSQHKGAVISTSIDKYIYITANKKFDSEIRCSYSKTENIKSANDIEHPIIRETLKLLNINTGIEITTVADIPSAGGGLGSSSSFTVGLVNALNSYLNKDITVEKLAEMACKIEIELCKEPIGKQDQYAAAFGGLNLFEFEKSQNVNVTPIDLSEDYLEHLNKMMLVFYTGISRRAKTVLTDQNDSLKKDTQKQERMKSMVDLAYDFKNALESERTDDLGAILMRNWELKKSMSEKITNDQINSIVEKGIQNGAIGAKLLGAGAGGFVMFLIPEARQNRVIQSLSDLKIFECNFSKKGTEIFKL